MTENPLRDLAQAATRLAEETLGLPADSVTVHFPADRMLEGAGKEIVAKVEGVALKTAYTDSALYGLAHAMGTLIKERFPAARKVECSVYDASGRRRGYWSSIASPGAPMPVPIAVSTSPIRCVDTNSRSVLPTGALRLEGGQLLQEATVITHRGPGMGVQTGVWLPVPEGDALLAAIRDS
jgi:hypothetical protein